MSCGVIIPAAGQGKRMGMGINKQYILLNDKPIIIHTIEKFINISWISEIVLVVHPNEINKMNDLLDKYQIKVKSVIPGGKERQDSIYNGLEYIDSDWVMVHDGARPFISKESLESLYHTVKEKNAVALGVPVKDTIKIIDDSGIITNTPNRKSLWAIQTPQAFRLSLLKESYQKAKEEEYIGTDDASLVERTGQEVSVLQGDYRNIKITTIDDLIIAKAILGDWRE